MLVGATMSSICSIAVSKQKLEDAETRRRRVLLAVSAVLLVAGDPLPRHYGAGQGDFAAEHGRADDFGELVHLARAVAAEHFQALALRGEARAAAVAGDDQRWDGDRVIQIAVRHQFGKEDRCGRFGNVGFVLTGGDEDGRDAVGGV